ncbi:MAG: hypothetical protein R3B13_13955 [Polyangiaceae bacterium]
MRRRKVGAMSQACHLVALICMVACSRERASGPTREPVPSSTPSTQSVPSTPAAPNLSAPLAASTTPPPLPGWRQKRGALLRSESSKDRMILQLDAGRLEIQGVNPSALGLAEGERIVVAAADVGSDRIDCSDPSRCSIGLESGGDVALFDVDAHQVAELFARAFRSGLLATGASHSARVQVRAKDADSAFAGMAAATGMRLGKFAGLRTLTRTAAPKTGPRLGLKGPRTDVALVNAELRDVLRFFSDVTRTPIAGMPQGRITIFAADRPSPELVEAVLATCAPGAKRDGRRVLVGEADASCGEPPPTTPRCAPSAEHSAVRGLPCVGVDQLRVAATFATAPGGALAMIRGDGPERSAFVVREGDLLDQKERTKTGDGRRVEVNWKVARITKESVELEWGLPEEGIPKRTRLLRPR